MNQKTVTIKDIALMAGVSKATVSRVLNNSGYVAADVRQKVEKIMAECNYVPSALAINLSRQETTTVGAIVPEIENSFYADIVHGITEITDAYGLSLLLFDTQNNPEKEKRAFRILSQQKVKGVILGPSVDYSRTPAGQELLAQLQTFAAPITVIDRDFENMPWDAVVYENYQSSYQAAIELHKAGNKRLAIITGDMELKIGRDRLRGFCQGAECCGLHIRKEDIYYGNFRIERAYELAQKLLSGSSLPDAVYTCNNATSLGFIKAAREHAIQIGKDIALIGNDRMETLDLLGIPFSCVYRDNFEMGRMAVRLLQERLEKPEKARNICVIPYQVRLNGSEKKQIPSA